MSVEISRYILSNLENKIPEIRYRALDTIESKFRNCHNNFDELEINPHDLVKYAIKWFKNTPISDGHRVLKILLKALESKYQREILKILNKKNYYTELKRINEVCSDDIDNAEQRLMLNKILTILSNFRKEELCNVNDNDSIITDRTNNCHSIRNSNENIQLDNAGMDDFDENVHRFSYVDAWDVPGISDLNSLQLLKTSLSVNADDASIEHALSYFDNIIHDFPGEYFLQPPFLFLDLLNLIELKDANSSKLKLLSATLELTKNLERRISIRRLTKTYYCKDLQKLKTCRKQIGIGTYCYEMFRVILHYVQEIYNTSKLHEINQCFYIFIEIIELLCLSASVCTIESNREYHIDAIINELSDFLRFIRESTSNYSINEYKIHRNNSITLIYLICRLLMFKDDRAEALNSNDISGIRKKFDEEKRKYDPNLYASSMNDSDTTVLTEFDDTSQSNACLSSIAQTYLVGEVNSLWKKELELALLDYPLKHFYPDVHQIIYETLKVQNYKESNRIRILLNTAEHFHPVIKILKEPQRYSDEQLLSEGLKAIDVLALVQSNELANKLFNSISNLAPQYDGNLQLKNKAENLLLRLFCHEYIDLKRLIYRLSSEKMSYFFSCIMDGTTLISKSYTANISQCNFLGLPLTTDILVEIICYGLTNDDSTIVCHAENILTLILRSRNLIPHFWNSVRELLVPVLPLLQCFASRKSTLGQLILDSSDPDSDCHLPSLRLIQANVILLFSRDSRAREESIYRLTYILHNASNAHLYIPNVNYLSDIIPSNICIVQSLVEPGRNTFDDLFDKTCLPSMLKLLSSPDIEPTIRKTTLIQMNVVFQDLKVVKFFYEIDGLTKILEILDHSLSESSAHNYTDNVIPIISMLAKLCLHLPHVRRQLAKDANLYLLLLRALLLYHQNESLKTDCAFVLFSMAFSDYLIGSNISMNLPNVCKRLLIPLKAEFQLHRTGNDAAAPLELLLSADTVSSARSKSQSEEATGENFAERKLIWQFLRMNFASLWFGSLNDIKLNGKKGKAVGQKPLINYQIDEKPLTFNPSLCLQQTDLDLIKSTSPKEGIDYWLRFLLNATTHQSVELSCAAIENFSNIDVSTKKLWDSEKMLNSLSRYCSIAPNGELDEMLFGSVLRLLGILVERDFREIHIWLLNEFQKKNCIFLNLLIDYSKISDELFINNAKFIEVVLIKTLKMQTNESINKNIYATQHQSVGKDKSKVNSSRNLYEKIFDLITNQLDDVFKERDLEKLRIFMSILCLITSSMQVDKDDYTVSFLANKILRFVTAIKALAQTGANFNKNCLLSIGNLMVNTDELRLDKKHIKLLSNLCGHNDFEIRTYSWSILTKVSNTLKGAECLIKELSYLPGGFHACCLSTFLDVYEPSIVREHAAFTFAALISYRNENGQLDERVKPLCIGLEEGAKVGQLDKSLLEKLLRQHKFFSEISISLDRFYGNESIGSDEFINNEKLTSSDLIRSFCIILNNLQSLKLNSMNEFILSIVMKLIRIIPQLLESVNKSSVLMLTELCVFLTNCFGHNQKIMERVAQEAFVIRALVALLNIELYENISKNIKCACWTQILTILTRFASTSIGFQTICDSFNEKHYFGRTFNLLIYGLTYDEFTNRVLKFIATMLIVSQLDEFRFKTFAQYLDEMYVDENFSATTVQNQLDPMNDCTQDKSNSDNDWTEEHNIAAGILFNFLSNLFENCDKTSRTYENVCKTLEALLKCSPVVRKACNDEEFLLRIADRLDEIVSVVGTNCQDYVRRHGNAKAEKIVHRIKIHLNIILSWYSVECLKKTELIECLLKAFMNVWSWLSINFDVQLRFVKLLSFLSEDSLPVCKGLATVSLKGSQTLLQLLIELCINETSKARNPQANLSVLDLSLRVVSNCCSCVEGRSQINKANMLHTLSRLHPQVTKQQKPWNQITSYWLQFYEILTRYIDANSSARHLSLFRVIIEQSPKKLRYHSLEIIRNFSFNTSNRSTLLASDDYLYIVQSILDNGTANEQLLIVSSIWKLIVQNYKGRHVIKNSRIYVKLRKLYEKLQMNANKISGTNENEDDDNERAMETLIDLNSALEHVLQILST